MLRVEPPRGGLHLDTISVAPQKRFGLWAEAGDELYGHLTFRRETQRPFRGQIDARLVGPLLFVRTEADPITAFRMSKGIRGGSEHEGYTLKLNLFGQCTTGVNGERIVVHPGDLVLIDREMLDYVDCEGGGAWGELDLHLPWSLVQPYADKMRRIVGVPFSGASGISGLLYRYLVDLDATMQREVNDLDDPHLVDSLLELVLALCMHEHGTSDEHGVQGHERLLRQVKFYIEERIGESDLQASGIARDNFISTRLLYKLFESEGISVGRWIRDRRLERCRRDLVDHALSDLTIAQIAYRWGFTSPAHFSRTFSTHLGVSPSEYRRLHGSFAASALVN